MPSCHTRSFMFRRILTTCVFEITSRRRTWILLTFVNTLKRVASAEHGASFSRERSSSYCSPSASTFTKGILGIPLLQKRPESSCGLHVYYFGSVVTLVIDGLYCFLNLFDLAKEFFEWYKSFSVYLKNFCMLPWSLAELLMLWYAQDFIQQGTCCQVPLMLGEDDTSCKMGFAMLFISAHLSHCNYIKFWKRLCN